MAFCPTCQYRNREGLLHCTQCGAKLPRQCPTCDSPVEGGDRFCGSCGGELNIDPPGSDSGVLVKSESSIVSTVPQELRDLGELLASLEEEVAEKALELETLKAELHAFEFRYLRIVGSKYAELDRLKARIAELRAKANPGDEAAQEEAERTRTQAEETENAQNGIDPLEAIPPKFQASDELKKLYREIVRQIHPDFAVDEEDRLRRTRLTAEANRAFETGDEGTLQRIMTEWSEHPETVTGDDMASQIRRLEKRIESLRRRLAAIENEMGGIRSSSLHRLKLEVEAEEARGRDILHDMATAVEQEIEAAEAELAGCSR